MDDMTLADILPVPDVKAEHFAVVSYSDANWCAVRAQKANQEKARWEVIAAMLHARVDEWLASMVKPEDATIEAMQFLLEPWVKNQLEGKKNRSFILPDGMRVGFRKTEDGLEIEDEAAAMAWAKANCPDAVKQGKEYLVKTPLKEHLETKGELPDGCKSVEARDTFYIKVESPVEK